MHKKSYNFTNNSTQRGKCVIVDCTANVPVYNRVNGYGFIEESFISPVRKLSVNKIKQTKDGYSVTQSDSTMNWTNENHYDYGGMIFRVDVDEPGAYKVEVTVTSIASETAIAITGMQPSRVLDSVPWDAAGLLHKTNQAKWSNNTWTYDYVTAQKFIDIEIEPLLNTKAKPENINITVGLSNITITKLNSNVAKENEKPTIYTLGDSTVKSYVFEEAGMSGWGQVFNNLFDLNRVNVVNYSMGGRSFKSIYQEGRLNEILMIGKVGDYILVQSGHNDESTGEEKGPEARFGRGNTADTYEFWIREVFIPAIRSRGMIPLLVTPMTRINSSKTGANGVVFAGFKNSNSPGIDFPKIMKQVAENMQVPVIDLYEKSIEYLNEIGAEAAKAMFLSFEPGETPSKTNSGSYANGNPSGNCDGTHYKETLAKQFARIVATKMYHQNLAPAVYLKDSVKRAIELNDWSKIYPEIANDIQTGAGAYYRNQIETLLKLGVMNKDAQGNFNPDAPISSKEFIEAFCKLWNMDTEHFRQYPRCNLTREVMAAIIMDGYEIKFGKDKSGNWIKPRYMTDYNGTNLSPDDANYDANLIGESAQYYPIVGWGQIVDKDDISNEYVDKMKQAYNLGLIRSELGIERGKMINGVELEPGKTVTKQKAAKALYFLWVLPKDIKQENDK